MSVVSQQRPVPQSGRSRSPTGAIIRKWCTMFQPWMKFDLLQHDHTFFDLAARHCLWPGRTCPLAEVLSGFSGLCGILQRPSAESSNLVSPGRVHSVARMSLHVHEPWRSYYQEHYHRRPHPPESPPSNDQCSNMNVTSRRASAKERYLPCSTPPHPKHWRTWYKMRTNTPCLWEVHSKKCAFSARPSYQQT